MSEAHSIYRHFDGTGRLLYVGCASNPVKRTYGHKAMSEWFRDVRTIRIEYWDTKEQALEAERRAVASEGPIYNAQHAKPKRDIKSGFQAFPPGVSAWVLLPNIPSPMTNRCRVLSRFGKLAREAMPQLSSALRRSWGAWVPATWVRDKVLGKTGSAARKPTKEIEG